MSLRKNDKLLLLDDSKHWWKVQNSQHQWGYVPSNYVKKEKPSIFDSIKKRVKKGNSNNKPSTSPGGSPVREVDSPGVIKRPPPDTSHYPTNDLNNGAHQGYALVRYNYAAQQPDELSLVKGTRTRVEIMRLNIHSGLHTPSRYESVGPREEQRWLVEGPIPKSDWLVPLKLHAARISPATSHKHDCQCGTSSSLRDGHVGRRTHVLCC